MDNQAPDTKRPLSSSQEARYRKSLEDAGGIFWQDTYMEPMYFLRYQYPLKSILQLPPGYQTRSYPTLNELSLVHANKEPGCRFARQLSDAFRNAFANEDWASALRYAFCRILQIRYLLIDEAQRSQARRKQALQERTAIDNKEDANADTTTGVFILRDRNAFPAFPAELRRVLHSVSYGTTPVETLCRQALGIHLLKGSIAGVTVNAPLYVVNRYKHHKNKSVFVDVPCFIFKAQFKNTALCITDEDEDEDASEVPRLLARIAHVFNDNLSLREQILAVQDLEFHTMTCQPPSELILPAPGDGEGRPQLRSLFGMPNASRQDWLLCTNLSSFQRLTAPLCRESLGPAGASLVLCDGSDGLPSSCFDVTLGREVCDPRRRSITEDLRLMLDAEEAAFFQAGLAIAGYARIAVGRDFRLRDAGSPVLSSDDYTILDPAFHSASDVQPDSAWVPQRERSPPPSPSYSPDAQSDTAWLPQCEKIPSPSPSYSPDDGAVATAAATSPPLSPSMFWACVQSEEPEPVVASASTTATIRKRCVRGSGRWVIRPADIVEWSVRSIEAGYMEGGSCKVVCTPTTTEGFEAKKGGRSHMTPGMVVDLVDRIVCAILVRKPLPPSLVTPDTPLPPPPMTIEDAFAAWGVEAEDTVHTEEGGNGEGGGYTVVACDEDEPFDDGRFPLVDSPPFGLFGPSPPTSPEQPQ